MDLTTVLKANTPVHHVNEWYEKNNQSRTHLGLSEVGEPCPRSLWYTHNKYPSKQPEGRVLRLFKLGHILESQMISDLRNAGYQIYNQQGEVRFEYQEITLCGHIDGEISGLAESKQTHLLEIKTTKDNEFNKLKKVGYEQWNEKYKAQIHVYMLGRNLNRCYVQVCNKNTSEIYDERIRADKEYAIKKLQFVFDNIIKESPPERLCPRSDWYLAKWCKYYDICFPGVF